NPETRRCGGALAEGTAARSRVLEQGKHSTCHGVPRQVRLLARGAGDADRPLRHVVDEAANLPADVDGIVGIEVVSSRTAGMAREIAIAGEHWATPRCRLEVRQAVRLEQSRQEE